METKLPIKIELYNHHLETKEQEEKPLLTLTREPADKLFTLTTKYNELIHSVTVDRTKKGFWITYQIFPFDRVRCFLSNKFLMKIEY